MSWIKEGAQRRFQELLDKQSAGDAETAARRQREIDARVAVVTYQESQTSAIDERLSSLLTDINAEGIITELHREGWKGGGKIYRDTYIPIDKGYASRACKAIALMYGVTNLSKYQQYADGVVIGAFADLYPIHPLNISVHPPKLFVRSAEHVISVIGETRKYSHDNSGTTRLLHTSFTPQSWETQGETPNIIHNGEVQFFDSAEGATDLIKAFIAQDHGRRQFEKRLPQPAPLNRGLLGRLFYT